MPKINEMLLELECFKYSTSIDLKIRYYHNQLIEDASNSCAVITKRVNNITTIY